MAKANNTKPVTGIPEKLQSYVESYPNEKTFYITSDGQVFLSQNKKEAETHQKFIDPDKTMDTFDVE